MMIVEIIEILMWVICVYLVLKGVQIFQTAFVLPIENEQRGRGLVIGVGAVIVAGITAVVALVKAHSVLSLVAKGIYPL